MLLAEGKVAEATAKGEHIEQQLTEMTRKLGDALAENRSLREDGVKSSQSTQALIANLNTKA